MSTEFEFDDEQRTLRGVVADFCRRQPRAVAGDAVAPGFDRDTWVTMAEQLSVAGLTVDPELGGAGAGLVEAGVVAEELGRALLPTPLVATVGLAATILSRCTGSEADAEACGVLEGIAAGTVVATAALTDASGRLDPTTPALTAREEDGAWYVDGTAAYVLEGGTADVVVCHAVAGAEPALLLVRTDADGLTREDVTPLDEGRNQATLTFDGVPATRLHTDRPVGAVVAEAVDTAATLLSAEQAGIATAMLDASVDYAKTRMQFGRAIGSFQAVKHRIADMYVEVENARSTSRHAMWALAEGGDDPALASSLALTTANDAARKVTRDAVQVHGGIGFTWEHRAHRYLKAALSNSTLLGGERLHGKRLADLALTIQLTEADA